MATPKITGARCLARALDAYGVTQPAPPVV